MTRTEFNSIFQRLLDRGVIPSEADMMFERFQNTPQSTCKVLVDRALNELRESPNRQNLHAISQDLTYWDPMDFLVDWQTAWFEETGESWFLTQDDKIQQQRDGWQAQVLGWRRAQIQKFAFNHGGRRAVKRILMDYASRGYLKDRSPLEFIDGAVFGSQKVETPIAKKPLTHTEATTEKEEVPF